MKEFTDIITRLIPWLEAKKKGYEEQGLIPTIGLLISDLEENEEVCMKKN